MSRKDVLCLSLNRIDAGVAADIIEERTSGADLKGTPFAALPSFSRKLRASLKRRRSAGDAIKMWTVNREEGEAGYRYLMLFSHEDVPSEFLTYAEMDAVHNVALDIAIVVFARRGEPGLGPSDIERRIHAWEQPHESADPPPDERWLRRLKKRRTDDRAFWETARRKPISPSVLALLAPQKNTRN